MFTSGIGGQVLRVRPRQATSPDAKAGRHTVEQEPVRRLQAMRTASLGGRSAVRPYDWVGENMAAGRALKWANAD